ncbi:MAG: hypothetical protein MUC49_14855 [Raineya sp.]|jgi:transcriptional regulator with XRE-family HTH domain|nr:hypothetical protein [Raineya sp.]
MYLDKIEILRNKANVSKEKIYTALDITRQRYNQKENQNNFTLKDLEIIANLFQVPITYFFESSTEKQNEMSSNVEWVDESKIKKIKVPVLPVEAFASFLESVDSGKLLQEVEMEFDTIEKIPHIKYDKLTAIAKISGNSMYPHYKSGAKVLCTFITDGNWEFTRGACVISLKNGMVLFKRVKAGLVKNSLHLISDNELGGEMEIQIADILAMWRAEYKTYEPAE